MKNIVAKSIQGYGLARSLNFFMQYHALSLAASALPFGKRVQPPANLEALKNLAGEVAEILKDDARNISEGVYPIKVLRPESPVDHVTRVPRLLWDGIKLNWRRSRKQTKSFGAEAQDILSELPEYYRRNFHFQTDGYLSARSAELYEHQVEMLFAGAADSMRRLLLRPLKAQIGDGSGLKILELGAGVGTMTRFAKLAFPKAKFVISDLSDPYLQIARRKLRNFDRIDFVQADAGQLPFAAETFDVVYSVFMFHELPLGEREKVIAESARVLKSGGLCGFVDSIQLKDRPDFEKILKQFPKDFHEPFYKNYIETPMEDLFSAGGFEPLESGHKFMSKYSLNRKTE